MSLFCDTLPIMVVYLSIIITCMGLGCADLLGRFRSGNSANSILKGGPQYSFYALCCSAGTFSFFGSEALGYTKIVETTSTNLPLAITQCTLFATATYFTLRTTVSNGNNIEVGPGIIFMALVSSIEKRIDQQRMVIATEEIQELQRARYNSPRGILYVMLPYCFDQSEKGKGNAESVASTLESIYKNTTNDTLEEEKSAIMLSHLHKEFGVAVLQSAAKLVSDDRNLTPDANSGADEKGELDLMLDQLIEKFTKNT